MVEQKDTCAYVKVEQKDTCAYVKVEQKDTCAYVSKGWNKNYSCWDIRLKQKLQLLR